MARLKGALKRAIMEYRYYTNSYYSFEDVGNFWDTVYRYDKIDYEVYAYHRRFSDTLDMCTFPDYSRLLDVDCRTGNGIIFYSKNKKLKEAAGACFSKYFLQQCKKKLRNEKVSANTFLLRKIPMPFKDNYFDVVLFLETLEHISNQSQFFNELNRVLKKGGELILSTPNLLWEPVHWFAAIFDIHHSEGPHRFLRKAKILRLLRASGFKVIKQRTTVIFPVGPKWLIKIGDFLERRIGRRLMDIVGLRRIFICKKIK